MRYEIRDTRDMRYEIREMWLDAHAVPQDAWGGEGFEKEREREGEGGEEGRVSERERARERAKTMV